MQQDLVIVRSHHFVVKNPSPDIVPFLYRLASNYTIYGFVFDKTKRKNVWSPIKTFGICVGGGEEFRFHINQLEEFVHSVEKAGVRHLLQFEYQELFEADDVELKVRDGWTLRPQQNDAKAFVLGSDTEGRSPLLSMPMGTGKTVTALVTASEIGKRLAVVVLSGYVDKWVKDVMEVYDIEREEICVIQGGTSVVNATHWIDANGVNASGQKLPKVFVFSIDTLSRWLKRYEENPHATEMEVYGCLPDELMQRLRVGTVIFDEIHQHLHKIFRFFCFLDVSWTISLSATMLSSDMQIARIQRMMFPRHRRFEEIKMEQYIKCYACSYQIQNFHSSKIRTTEFGSNRYSHTAYEKSLLSHKTLGKQYVDMIVNLAIERYHLDYIEGDKMVIFVGTHKMARRVCEELKRRLPQYDTRTYLEGDPYENAIDSDIRVTTIISMGTAFDVPNLRVSIMTNSIDSAQSNLQVLGRLRKLSDRDVKFFYLYSSSIQRHVAYHNNKVELFKPKVMFINHLVLETLRP